MELRLLPGLGDPTIFAATIRTIKNCAPQRDWHLQAAAACGRNARSLRSDSISAISTNPLESLEMRRQSGRHEFDF